MPSWTFTGRFRSYQQRVLDQAHTLACDGRLHVVAAPGSGKTILGLEVAGRRGQPTLVLSPSLTIRDQWLSRLNEHFATHTPEVAQHSTSIRTPAFITSTTYQSLHAAHERSTDEETGETFTDTDLLAQFDHIGTIILDEAHHLRSQWHNALVDFIARMKERNVELLIISLTATPPYDTTPAQWQRYIDLCGDIDAEISVPELVATGDLAPHQDYVLVGLPTEEEIQRLRDLRRNTAEAAARLANPDDQAGSARTLLTDAPLLLAPEEYLDACLDDEPGSLGLLLLLREWGVPLPEVLTLLLTTEEHAGSIEDGFAFILANPTLFPDAFNDAVTEALKSAHLLRGRKLINTTDLSANTLLVNSAGKCDSIGTIARHEAEQMGEDLRMLILADHIRADMRSLIGTDQPLVQLGVVPAFEAARRALAQAGTPRAAAAAQSMGVLTGSLLIAPSPALERLNALASQHGVELSTRALPNCEDYLIVSGAGAAKTSVRIFTEALAEGTLTILVGTAALLGEGWDCPQLNTLVLASTIKATMMSNQMRGRVIRIDPAVPDKVAHVWHLATADPVHLLNRDVEKDELSASRDFRALSKRFTTFVGPRAYDPVVENGIERCAGKSSGWTDVSIPILNKDTLSRSSNRLLVAQLWRQAIDDQNYEGGGGIHLRTRAGITLPEVKIVAAAEMFVAAGVAFGAMLVFETLRFFARAGTWGPLTLAIYVLAAVIVVTWGVLSWYFRRPLLYPEHRIRRQSQALVQALRSIGLITSDSATVDVDSDDQYTYRASLSGASDREEQVFAQALTEMYAPVRNPRYILIPALRHLPWKTFFAQNVPQVIGSKREHVDIFVDALKTNGVHMHALYVRSVEGRAYLLKARKHAASNRGAGTVDQRRYMTARRVYGR